MNNWVKRWPKPSFRLGTHFAILSTHQEQLTNCPISFLKPTSTCNYLKTRSKSPFFAKSRSTSFLYWNALAFTQTTTLRRRLQSPVLITSKRSLLWWMLYRSSETEWSKAHLRAPNWFSSYLTNCVTKCYLIWASNWRTKNPEKLLHGSLLKKKSSSKNWKLSKLPNLQKRLRRLQGKSSN